MDAAVDMLKPTEAAVVASVALRDVNRAIDEHILPEGFVSHDDGRRVAFTACILISFYVESAERLTAKERTSTIHEAGLRLRKFQNFDLKFMVEHDWTVRHDFVTIDLAPFARRTRERMERLTAAREAVVSDPEILGGTPVLRGTRVPAYDVAASVEAGISTDRILAAYPSISAKSIELATIYAAANPPRGRPRSTDERATASVIVDKRVARRGKAV
jgi:uncharacterized protein (DUF433 family)